MKLPMWRYSLVVVLCAVFLLTACSPAPAQPAVDPNAIYTQAAQTVAAQLSQTAEALPTSTPTLEPTETPLPPTATFTLEPATATIEPLFTLTVAPTQGAAAPAGSSTCQTGQGDKACFAYNVPADGGTFNRNDEFLFAIGLINAGTTTWNSDYKLMYLSGQPIGRVSSINVIGTVKPGDKTEFNMQVVMPTTAGTYTTHWKFVNPQGVFIYEVYFQYKVK